MFIADNQPTGEPQGYIYLIHQKIKKEMLKQDPIPKSHASRCCKWQVHVKLPVVNRTCMSKVMLRPKKEEEEKKTTKLNFNGEK